MTTASGLIADLIEDLSWRAHRKPSESLHCMSTIHTHLPTILSALRRVEKMEAALEIIAEEHDSGRHDGLPEPCPAHDADTMFAIARQALTGEAQ